MLPITWGSWPKAAMHAPPYSTPDATDIGFNPACRIIQAQRGAAVFFCSGLPAEKSRSKLNFTSKEAPFARRRSGSIAVVLSRVRPLENYSIVYAGSVHLLIIVLISTAALVSR